MSLSDQTIKKFQEIFKKEYGKEISYAEAADSAERLVGVYTLLYDTYIEDLKRKEKLKEFPKGYSFMDGKTYSCGICRGSIKDGELWYDKWGIKCLACQKAVDKKIVPGRICHDNKDWYTMWEMDSYFKLKSPAVRSLIKLGILKARIIPDNRFYVFLIKDNVDVLPPKELLKSRTVQAENNMISSEDWYNFKNPEKVLGNYKIWPYLKAFQAKPSNP